jgi:NAD(P)H dehydrogenase (quinone)
MSFGITGASGQLGISTLRHLVARLTPADVVAITRHPQKVRALAPAGIEVRSGDFDDYDGLTRAMAGVDRLLLIPGSNLTPGVRSRQHRRAIAAAVAAGVRHVIYVSSVGARPGPSDGLLETHFATEQALMDSGLSWTVLRTNIFADPQLAGVRRALDSGVYVAPDGAPSAYSVRDDLGAAAAAVLATRGHARVTYHATGPLSVTHAQIADALATAAGRPVAYTPLSAAQSTAGLSKLGLPPVLVDTIGRFEQAARDGAFDLVSGDVARLTGVRAQSPLDFIVRAVTRPAAARTRPDTPAVRQRLGWAA